MLTTFALVAAIAVAAPLAPVRTESIPLPRSGDSAYVLRVGPEAASLVLENHGDAPVDAAVYGAPAAVHVRVQPDESVALADLLPAHFQGTLMIDGEVDLVRRDLDALIVRRSLLRENEPFAIARSMPEAVGFFVANVSSVPLRAEIEGDGLTASVAVGAGQLAEFSDVFAAFPAQTTAVVIRSSTPGAQLFAGPIAASLTPRAAAPPKKLKRRSVDPGHTVYCEDVIRQLNATMNLIDALAASPAEALTPAAAESCSDTQNGANLSFYRDRVVEPERTLISKVVDLYRNLELLGGCGQPEGSNPEVKALADHLKLKVKAMGTLGTTSGTPTHLTLLAGMVAIQKYLTLLGVSTEDIDAYIPTTAAGWEPTDEKWYIDKIRNEHDFASAYELLNYTRALDLLGVTTGDKDHSQMWASLSKAMTCKLKMDIYVDVKSTAGGGQYRAQSHGEGVVTDLGIDPAGSSAVPVHFKVVSAERWNKDYGWCTIDGIAPSDPTAVIQTLFCPAVHGTQIKLMGDLGGGSMGTMKCPSKPDATTASELTTVIKAAFQATGNPNQILNQPVLHDPEFNNRSATPIDESWSITPVQGLSVVINLTLTHEPAK